jgi:hypothetical protein
LKEEKFQIFLTNLTNLARILLIYKCWLDNPEPDAFRGCQPLKSKTSGSGLRNNLSDEINLEEMRL